MRYNINQERSRADFVAYAPMHKFCGWAVNTIVGQVEVDLEQAKIENFAAKASTMSFATGDASRNKAMQEYFNFLQYPETSFYITDSIPLANCGDIWKGELTGILELAGVRRQLPVDCIIRKRDQLLVFDLSLNWSFKAFAMKAPRLLFMTVRDIVDIHAVLYCQKEE